MSFIFTSFISRMVVGSTLVSQSYPTLGTSWTIAHKTPLSMEFPRQEYQGGLPFHSSCIWDRARLMFTNKKTNKKKHSGHLNVTVDQQIQCL